MKRALIAIIAVLTQLLLATTSIAKPSFSVSVADSTTYNPANDSFAISSIQINNPPSYIQVDLSLVYLDQTLVEPSDRYRIAVGVECTFESKITNPVTAGVVNVSGDNSTVVLLDGAAGDVQAALSTVWIYNSETHSCIDGAPAKLNQQLMLRKLQISAVESQSGLKWSPFNQHYYYLATQTTDDGLGQPTNDNSRYFVKWSTARAEAKSTTITISGHTHTGYLAAITSKEEFNFLNNNVSGGSGIVYPAWAGGTDNGHEGVWKWVDGPEALQYGGDTLTHDVDTTVYTDPYGTVYKIESDGNYVSRDIYNQPTYLTVYQPELVARDSDGNVLYDTNGTPLLVDTKDCLGPDDYISTPAGLSVYCNWWFPTLYDSAGADYPSTWDYYNVPLDSEGRPRVGEDGYIHQVAISDLVQSGGPEFGVPNYEGYNFWGPDTNSDWLCTQRGARGYCSPPQQQDIHGNWYQNYTFVYWSTGDRSHVRAWDGVHTSEGDGVYSPQPDNAALNGMPDENGLVVNWCERNSVPGNSYATEETLYGSSGYYCTPGWNDLNSGDWGVDSNNDANGFSYDTPNQIGTTDYIVEFCGYETETDCNTDPAAIVYSGFAIDQTPYANPSDTRVRLSFLAAETQNVTVDTDTMVIENFDNLESYFSRTNVGNADTNFNIQNAGYYGGAGGSGQFPSTGGTGAVITLPTTERFVGFWWSAGNWQNHVDLLDDNDNVLQTISTADVLGQLGACDGTNPYCGNPNNLEWDSGEPFAYINIRYAPGFTKIRFAGDGFEFDNLAISVSIPASDPAEKVVPSGTVNLDCSSATAASASAHLTACPQEVWIYQYWGGGYYPLNDSHITGYNYPNDVTVTDAYVSSGVGTASFDGSGNVSYNSDVSGVFYVDYELTRRGERTLSRITVNVIPFIPPPPSPPTIVWNSPAADKQIELGDSFAASWEIVAGDNGIGYSGNAVRQVASYAGDLSCMSDWTSDSYAWSNAPDVVSAGHCYRWSFSADDNGSPPTDAYSNPTTEGLYSPVLIVPFKPNLVASHLVLVDPRLSNVQTPEVLVTSDGGSVQACIRTVDSDGDYDASSQLHIDIGGNGSENSSYRDALVSGDLGNLTCIYGSSYDVGNALSSVRYRLSGRSFSSSFRVEIAVAPYIESIPDEIACFEKQSSGLIQVISPYALSKSHFFEVSLFTRG